MHITEEQHNQIHIVTIEGRLDSNTAPTLEESIAKAIARGEKQMIIDFVRLEYISSAGLRVILKTAKDLKRLDGKLALSSMVDYIKEVFEIAGFNTFLTITDNRHEAERLFITPIIEKANVMQHTQ
jgi:anti-sigma B factor antagonist